MVLSKVDSLFFIMLREPSPGNNGSASLQNDLILYQAEESESEAGKDALRPKRHCGDCRNYDTKAFRVRQRAKSGRFPFQQRIYEQSAPTEKQHSAD
jgi:hypothetical protein